MSHVRDKLLGGNFVFEAIEPYVRMKAMRFSRPGKLAFDCPMCVPRGYTRDTRKRGALLSFPDGFGVSCFNCSFRSKFVVGMPMSRSLRDFCAAVGVPSEEVGRLHYRAFQVSRMITEYNVTGLVVPPVRPQFDTMALPPGAQTIAQWAAEDVDDPDFWAVAQYMLSRGDDVIAGRDFYWSPWPKKSINKRLIIPAYCQGHIVGWTGRSADPTVEPKYWGEMPPHLLFNSDAMDHPTRKFVIVVEGILDALSLDCVAVMKADISDVQARWLNDCGKHVVVLADRDKSGAALIDLALQNKWAVSMPRDPRNTVWDADIKDAADAVKRYGRLYTLDTIVRFATDSATEIASKRRYFIGQ